jgi:hypothetical protein
MSYRIFFHHGPDLNFSTKVERGRMEVDSHAVTFIGEANPIRISFGQIKDIQLIRLHKIGRVVRIDHENGTSFLSVIRLMIGRFAITNFYTTGRAFKRIKDAVRREHEPS